MVLTEKRFNSLIKHGVKTVVAFAPVLVSASATCVTVSIASLTSIHQAASLLPTIWQTNELWVVNFFAPWCSHCNRFKATTSMNLMITTDTTNMGPVHSFSASFE